MTTTKPKPDRTTDPPSPDERATRGDRIDPTTKRISRARQMVKDAVDAMATIRVRIVDLRSEADDLERELFAMIDEMATGGAVAATPIERDQGGETIEPKPLNGHRIDAVVAPGQQSSSLLGKKPVSAMTNAELEDELGYVTPPKRKNEVITLERIKEIANEPIDDEPDDAESIMEHLDAIEAEANAPPPVMFDELAIKLREALGPDDKRWAEYRRLGIDDKTLLVAIGIRFEAVPREKKGRRWSCIGGDDPRFWTSGGGYKSARGAIRGHKLCDDVREAMELGAAPK